MSETDESATRENARDDARDEASHAPSARVEVLVSEHFDGNVLASPVAATALASYGRESEALAEQGLFLREYLARVPPESLARLSLPAGVLLRQVGVILPGDDLPRKLRGDTEVSFACVIVPASGEAGAPEIGPTGKASADLWVMVPILDHTFFVEQDELLDEAVRSEVTRLLVSQDLSRWEVMGYLPARTVRLTTLEIPLPSIARGEKGAARREAIAQRARRKVAVEALTAVSMPLHLDPQKGAPPPVVARDAELALLTALLEGKGRLGVLLVGAEHTGKSALLHAYLARGTRPVYQSSGAQLIAGMSGLGQWQSRIRAVMEGVETLDAVLYFESLEDLLAEQRESGGADLAGAMRPFLDEGKVRIVAEIRPDELDRLEGRNWAFFAAFSRIKLDPLPPAEALAALTQRAAHDARTQPHKPRVEAAALPALIDLAERYLPYGAFPGKAIRLYQDLRASREKERAPGGGPPTLGKTEVYRFFSLTTGVPEILLRDDAPLRIADVAASLRKQIIGQDDAITCLVRAVKKAAVGLKRPTHPVGTFLLVGRTGTGKTELAKAVARNLFDDPGAMIRVDCSEYALPHEYAKLIGSPPGYIGHNEGGFLTEAIKKKPNSVVL
ncbi:MAG: AAA family ATPase, partial [Minicystis sp.]